MSDTRVSQVALPGDSVLTSIYKHTNLADAYMVQLPGDVVASPAELAKFMFAHQAAWVGMLMKVREVFARAFGLNTTLKRLMKLYEEEGKSRIHYFRVHSSGDKEIILGEDDKHLDFRLSILYRKPDETDDNLPRLVISSVVTCHNLLGRIYLFIIAPFHRIVVCSGLRRAAKAGWPKVSGS